MPPLFVSFFLTIFSVFLLFYNPFSLQCLPLSLSFSLSLSFFLVSCNFIFFLLFLQPISFTMPFFLPFFLSFFLFFFIFTIRFFYDAPFLSFFFSFFLSHKCFLHFLFVFFAYKINLQNICRFWSYANHSWKRSKHPQTILNFPWPHPQPTYLSIHPLPFTLKTFFFLTLILWAWLRLMSPWPCQSRM